MVRLLADEKFSCELNPDGRGALRWQTRSGLLLLMHWYEVFLLDLGRLVVNLIP